MKRHSPSILLYFCIFLLSGTAFSQTISLRDAIQSALERNDKIKEYKEKETRKELSLKEAWGNFLPKVQLTASYTHLNDPMAIDLEPIRQVIMNVQASNQVEFSNVYNLLQGKAPLTSVERQQLFSSYYSSLDGKLPPFKETLKEQNYKTATITGVQPIFTGGKLLAARDYAEDEVSAALYEQTRVTNDITQQTISVYLSVLLVEKVVQTRKDVLAGVRKHYERAKKLFAEGLIVNYHVLRAETAVSEAERNLFDEENRLELAYYSLKYSMGIPTDADILVSDSLLPGTVPEIFETYQSQMETSQPIFLLLAKKQDEAEQMYRVERSKFLPTIAAFGKYELYPEYLSSLEPRWAVGITASINLFNGLQDITNLESAECLQKEVQYLTADTKSKFTLLLRKNYTDVQNAQERYNKTAASVSLAKENLRLCDKRFDTGLGTSLEVIDAQLLLEKFLIEREISLYEYYRSLSELLLTTGAPIDFLQYWKQ